MEFFIFFGILAVVGIVLLWRSRRNTTSWRESPNAWRSDQNPARYDHQDSREQDYAAIADSGSRPVSREAGHGKDGGG
jgi:hypothetical protein